MELFPDRRAFLSLLTVGAALPAVAFPSQEAPPFTVMDQNGQTIRLADFKGKTVLITFWATWCPHCRRQIASMDKMREEAAERKVVFLALSVDKDGWKKVKPYLRENDISLTVAMATSKIEQDYQANRGVPLNVVVNNEGYLLGEALGALPPEALRQIIEKFGEDA